MAIASKQQIVMVPVSIIWKQIWKSLSDCVQTANSNGTSINRLKTDLKISFKISLYLFCFVHIANKIGRLARTHPPPGCSAANTQKQTFTRGGGSGVVTPGGGASLAHIFCWQYGQNKIGTVEFWKRFSNRFSYVWYWYGYYLLLCRNWHIKMRGSLMCMSATDNLTIP